MPISSPNATINLRQPHNLCKAPMKRTCLILFPVICLLFSCQPASSSTVETTSASSSVLAAFNYQTKAYESGENERFASLAAPEFASKALASSIALSLEEKTTEFEGAGAAMTHSSAYTLETMSPALKQQALKSLFSAEEGHLSFVRIPLGTSDYTYTSSFYTFDDLSSNATDYDLADFSLGEDTHYLIPALKDALAINPNITFIAAPWSAPAWMKDSKSLLGGSLIANGDGTNSKEEIAYASYLVKAVEAYQAAGISIRYLSLENEPIDFGGSINYPNMSLPAAQWKRVAKSVGYQLKAKGLATTILAYDHNVGTTNENSFFQTFASEIKNDATLSSYVSGFAFHCYSSGWSTTGASYLAQVRQDFPNKKIFITEITEHSGSGSSFGPRFDWAMDHVILSPMNAAGIAGVCYWNLCLTDQGKPVLGNGAVCYGLLSLQNSQLTKEPALDALSQLTHFLQKGTAKQPQELPLDLSAIADLHGAGFRKEDGTLIVAMENSNDSSLSFGLTLSGYTAPLTIKAHHALVCVLSPK